VDGSRPSVRKHGGRPVAGPGARGRGSWAEKERSGPTRVFFFFSFILSLLFSSLLFPNSTFKSPFKFKLRGNLFSH
jgi:hypothetical protein